MTALPSERSVLGEVMIDSYIKGVLITFLRNQLHKDV